ncbi:hypothetical protein DH2020_033708 [Rehmannia glutinosa]|uniref:Pollen Ole e 1 allergen and extensin family protein n=1 Tax=Rehmannia glutinosa TaxID=99300 RepID=A0ABR0VBZ8_REHGL
MQHHSKTYTQQEKKRETAKNKTKLKIIKMAKAVALVSALCILAIAAAAHGHQQSFNVEGAFTVTLAVFSATVKLECRDLETKALTYSTEGVTGANGHYSLKVVGDHANAICEVGVVKSPRPDCSEPLGDLEKSRVVLTANDGLHAAVRFANPIGFQTKTAIPHYFRISDIVLLCTLNN